MAKPRLMTSNPMKLREYRRLGLDVEMDAGLGGDLPEIVAGPVEVAMRKAMMAGPGAVVDDTSLDVEGMDIGVNIRWMMEDVGALMGKRAVYRVALAFNDGEIVRAYVGEVMGLIGSTPGEEGGFGFDRWFFPDEAPAQSLLSLERAGRKDEFSARGRAVLAYKKSLAVESRALADFAPWEGEWQEEGPISPSERSAGPGAR